MIEATAARRIVSKLTENTEKTMRETPERVFSKVTQLANEVVQLLFGLLWFAPGIALAMAGHGLPGAVLILMGVIVPGMINEELDGLWSENEIPGYINEDGDRVARGTVTQVIEPDQHDEYMIDKDLTERADGMDIVRIEDPTVSRFRRWVGNAPIWTAVVPTPGIALIVDPERGLEVGDDVEVEVSEAVLEKTVDAYVPEGEVA